MEDVNCDPQLEVMTEGIPHRGIRYLNRAPAHSEAVIDLTVTASSHLEVLSNVVRIPVDVSHHSLDPEKGTETTVRAEEQQRD